jgi:hypothetical protein
MATVALSAYRSTGLTRITITALSAEAEPRDLRFPLFKQKEALPDYQVFVVLQKSGRLNLGTKPDQSAVKGINWNLPSPVSVYDIASIKLQDDDKLISDAISEVQIDEQSVTDGNYRFDFHTERSFSVGLHSFFQTPIGQAISAAFLIAVLLVIAAIFCA